jgi:Domain of unknown function (DUF4160)
VQPLHHLPIVPRIARFPRSEIAMYFADHNPPHFHVLGREGAAQVRIDTLEPIARSGVVDLTDALAWAGRNQELLWRKWSELSGDRA